MNLLGLEALRFAYPGCAPILDGISATVAGPELIGIAGPNGAGKSTLLDLLCGQRVPLSGRCLINGQDIAGMDRAALCQLVAHVPQQVPDDVPYTVADVVLTGRTPYGRGLFESDDDIRVMEAALSLTRLEGMRHRIFQTLSGGERQRVLVAAALCQQAPILLLDEPSAHLDPEHQADLWELLHALRAEGRLILVVTHHLGMAAQFCGRIWLLHQGRLVADGPPCDALRPELLQDVFHVPFFWHQNEKGRVFLSYGR